MRLAGPDAADRPETRLVVLTEQYLLLNPLLLPQIQKRAGAERVLVILDEALFLTTAVCRRFTRVELLRFRAALAETAEAEPDNEISGWTASISCSMTRSS